ncbi:MAG TPA: T3SS effector HopA1 family protein [Gemmatimonadaceae bacterium]|nr:T3SS effector HopA1 family protein [Gemmatimonadaceae bacterium]
MLALPTGPLRAQLRATLESFAVVAPDAFSIFGMRYRAADASSGSQVLTAAAQQVLATVLYNTLHCRRSVFAQRTVAPRQNPTTASLVAELGAANSGTGWWDGSWRAGSISKSELRHVEHDDLHLWATSDNVAVSPAPNDAARVRFPPEYRNLYPGHYVVLGDASNGQRIGQLRTYWHVTPAGAASLTRAISDRFNDAGAAFQLKVLNDVRGFGRADAAILYTRADDWSRDAAIVAEIHDRMRDWMRPEVSAFTRPLRPGLSVAEDPVEPMSFGEQRAALLAQAFVEASRHGAQALTRVEEVIDAFGYDLDRFHLNSESHRDYELS